jgi:hypothetical protein
MVETVQGPVRGYYVAAYACPVGEYGREYVGYYKIFGERPQGFFDAAVCLLKGSQEEIVRDAQHALRLAIESAGRQVHNLPQASELAACRERRRPYIWELQALGLDP